MSIRRSVVKWFDAKKGYGFIVHPDGGGDVFVHYSTIGSDRRFKTLRTGQVVEFELSDGPKGLHANNVMPTDEPDQLEGLTGESSFADGSYREMDISSGGMERSIRSGL
jgi:cold shock protein